MQNNRKGADPEKRRDGAATADKPHVLHNRRPARPPSRRGEQERARERERERTRKRRRDEGESVQGEEAERETSGRTAMGFWRVPCTYTFRSGITVPKGLFAARCCKKLSSGSRGKSSVVDVMVTLVMMAMMTAMAVMPMFYVLLWF